VELREIMERLAGRVPDAGLSLAAPENGDPWITAPAARLRDVCLALRDDPGLAMDYLRCLSGVDRGDRIEVVYHLVSLRQHHGVTLKVELDRGAPAVDSVQDLWRTANWFEREAMDLVGIQFVGHPNLVRLMMPPDWVGHPLRKDYEQPPEYHGISTTRPDLLGGKDA